jgi:hypothetical protein
VKSESSSSVFISPPYAIHRPTRKPRTPVNPPRLSPVQLP